VRVDGKGVHIVAVVAVVVDPTGLDSWVVRDTSYTFWREGQPIMRDNFDMLSVDPRADRLVLSVEDSLCCLRVIAKSAVVHLEEVLERVDIPDVFGRGVSDLPLHIVLALGKMEADFVTEFTHRIKEKSF